MRFYNTFVLLTLYFVHCRCEEKLEPETDGKEESRNGKQLLEKVEHGGWRTVGPQEWRSSDEWMPKEEDTPINANEYLANLPRRRRIRKRKRRPPVVERTEPPPPHTLEDAEEIWVEMEEESIKVPHSRRRVVPVYLSDSEEHEDISPLYEKVRDPFTALEEVEAKSRLKKKSESENTTASNLKAILKQSGGTLNLSELLQRKNLSLADLLNGKHQAISALTEKSEMSTEATKFKFESVSNPKQEISNDVNYVKHFDTISTEPATEKKVFIPTYPKIIPFNYKHTTVKVTSTIAPVTLSTASTTKSSNRTKFNEYRNKYVALRPKLQNPVANNAVQVTTPNPLRAFTIDLQELFGFSDVIPTGKKSADEPLHMKIDVNDIKTTTEFAKLRPTNAREEILEVLKDQRSRQNLSRILLIRNMTFDELVAQRERGSSQIHLADIFHNRTREPEPPSEPHVGIISEHGGGRKSKTLQNSKSVDANLLNTDNKTNFPGYKISRDKLQQNQTVPLHVWKTLYPNLYAENASKALESNVILSESKASVDEVLHTDVHRIENVENTISEAGNHKLNVEIIEKNNYEDGSGFTRLPHGVKSAIIASTALVALSLLVFLTILIICKWTNKKKRLCYSDVYSGTRIKSPILEPRPKRTIRTIMNETLGRHKRYSNVYPQNISDYFWESDKKPFQ